MKEKPKKEKYGWYDQQGFDDEPSGWLIEGGEEAYYAALEEWQLLGRVDVYNEIFEFLESGHEGFSKAGLDMIDTVKNEITDLFNKAKANQPNQ